MIVTDLYKKFEEKNKGKNNNVSDDENIWSYVISLIYGDASEYKDSQDNSSYFQKASSSTDTASSIKVTLNRIHLRTKNGSNKWRGPSMLLYFSI